MQKSKAKNILSVIVDLYPDFGPEDAQELRMYLADYFHYCVSPSYRAERDLADDDEWDETDTDHCQYPDDLG